MTNEEFVSENTQLLLSCWERLQDGESPGEVGLSPQAADALIDLERCQVTRCAQVYVPLFSVTRREEVLENALQQQADASTSSCIDKNTFLFLVNRWRWAASSLDVAQMKCGLTAGAYKILRCASLEAIQAAAAAKIDLMELSVRWQYLFHAGKNFAMENDHRTRLAICNSVSGGVRY